MTFLTLRRENIVACLITKTTSYDMLTNQSLVQNLSYENATPHVVVHEKKRKISSMGDLVRESSGSAVESEKGKYVAAWKSGMKKKRMSELESLMDLQNREIEKAMALEKTLAEKERKMERELVRDRALRKAKDRALKKLTKDRALKKLTKDKAIEKAMLLEKERLEALKPIMHEEQIERRVVDTFLPNDLSFENGWSNDDRSLSMESLDEKDFTSESFVGSLSHSELDSVASKNYSNILNNQSQRINGKFKILGDELERFRLRSRETPQHERIPESRKPRKYKSMKYKSKGKRNNRVGRRIQVQNPQINVGTSVMIEQNKKFHEQRLRNVKPRLKIEEPWQFSKPKNSQSPRIGIQRKEWNSNTSQRQSDEVVLFQKTPPYVVVPKAQKLVSTKQSPTKQTKKSSKKKQIKETPTRVKKQKKSSQRSKFPIHVNIRTKKRKDNSNSFYSVPPVNNPEISSKESSSQWAPVKVHSKQFVNDEHEFKSPDNAFYRIIQTAHDFQEESNRTIIESSELIKKQDETINVLGDSVLAYKSEIEDYHQRVENLERKIDELNKTKKRKCEIF